MSQELLKRAEAIRARNKLLETVPGTGFHDKDPSSPQRNGLSRGGEHCVPFYDYDLSESVTFVGPDAERVYAALLNWHGKPKGDVVSLPGTERKLQLKTIPRLKLATADGLPRLTVGLSDWNDVLYALYAEGVGLSGAPLIEPATAQPG